MEIILSQSLEFGNQREKIRVLGCAKARSASIGPMKAQAKSKT